jgi:hypothetical protein
MVVFDNSDSNPENPPKLVAEGLHGTITIHEPLAIPVLTAALQRASKT